MGKAEEEVTRKRPPSEIRHDIRMVETRIIRITHEKGRFQREKKKLETELLEALDVKYG